MARSMLRFGAALALTVLVSSIAQAEVLELEGIVKAVDAEDRSITIERKTAKGTKTLELEVAKKAGDISGLKVGDAVDFAYNPDLEIVTRIAGRSRQAKSAVSAGDDAPARPFLDTMLKAIKENDYDSFVANTSAAYKATLTKQIVAGISEQLAPRMKKGHDITFLTELKQRGQKAYLWKVTFKDNGDEGTVKIWLKDGKVTGSLWQF
jgi:Cu/Ag efflux protein CusF